MSKATKILDLDKFSSKEPERTITIKSIEYPVVEMSFENFVETTKQAQRLEADETASTVEHMEASISMIQRTVPSIPSTELREMSLTKLGIIIKFLNGELDEELEKTASDAVSAGGAEAKK